MDKIIDKMNLYDIWMTFFPDALFGIAVKSIYGFMQILPNEVAEVDSLIGRILLFCKIDLYAPGTVYELIVFLICSCFCGLILHEISDLYKKRVLFRNGLPMDFILKEDHGTLKENELKKMLPVFEQMKSNSEETLLLDGSSKSKEQSRLLFHTMHLLLQKKKIASLYEKLNVICNMSGSLEAASGLIFLLLVVYELEFLFLGKCQLIISTIALLPITAIIYSLFKRRCKKYCVYWTRNIVLAYGEMIKEAEGGASKVG